MDSEVAMYLGVVLFLAIGLVALWTVTIRAVQPPGRSGQTKVR